ncbi:MAG: hypothetical protein JWN72_2472, partial [Thermoleophilia bacterium]|nr:hypothetical protein [Thermoleophilia bacterium]
MKLSIDTPPVVLSTTATGEVAPIEAATIALFGWEE